MTRAGGGSAGFTAAEKADEGVEAVLVGADDVAGEGVGEMGGEGGVAFLAPAGVGAALGVAATESDEAAGERIEGGDVVGVLGVGAVPRIVHPQAEEGEAAGEGGPALGEGARGVVGEPDDNTVAGSKRAERAQV